MHLLRLIVYQVVGLPEGLIGPNFLIVLPAKWALVGLYRPRGPLIRKFFLGALIIIFAVSHDGIYKLLNLADFPYK